MPAQVPGIRRNTKARCQAFEFNFFNCSMRLFCLGSPVYCSYGSVFDLILLGLVSTMDDSVFGWF